MRFHPLTATNASPTPCRRPHPLPAQLPAPTASTASRLPTPTPGEPEHPELEALVPKLIPTIETGANVVGHILWVVPVPYESPGHCLHLCLFGPAQSGCPIKLLQRQVAYEVRPQAIIILKPPRVCIDLQRVLALAVAIGWVALAIGRLQRANYISTRFHMLSPECAPALRDWHASR